MYPILKRITTKMTAVVTRKNETYVYHKNDSAVTQEESF